MTEPPWDLWDYLGIKASHVVAGILGGLVRWVIAPQSSLTRNMSATMVSMLACIYGTPVLSPAVTHYFGDLFHNQAGLDGACGFLLGVSGYSIISGIIRMVSRWSNDPHMPRMDK